MGIHQLDLFAAVVSCLAYKRPINGKLKHLYLQNKLTFDFNKLKVRLGPKWFDINLGSMEKFQGK